MEPSERRERALHWALVIVCVAVVAVAWLPRLPRRPAAPVPETPELVVAVVGEVGVPGRYSLPWGARVGDAVEAAGGTTAYAAATLIDPATPLVDGAHVHVPRSRSSDGDVRVSLNEASAAELEALPGIGPALAARIVAARPFHRIDDLERVRGIGPATMDRLRDRVRP